MAKPRGYFKFILAMDCETNGLFFSNASPCTDAESGDYYQPLSWGMIVLDADTLEEVDRLYVEVKWDGKSLWNAECEKVHGLTKEHLEQNGVTEEEAIMEIGNMIIKYWGTDSVVTLGHNVASFDLPFLVDMFKRHNIHLNFGNRHIDTNSAGFLTFGTYNSDELFEAACLPERKTHNALEDIEFTVESARAIKLVFTSALEG